MVVPALIAHSSGGDTANSLPGIYVRYWSVTKIREDGRITRPDDYTRPEHSPTALTWARHLDSTNTELNGLACVILLQAYV